MSWRADYLALIGLLVRKRQETGLSQEALAKKIRVGVRTLQRWESGSHQCKAPRLFQWSAVLGVRITSQVTPSEVKVR